MAKQEKQTTKAPAKESGKKKVVEPEPTGMENLLKITETVENIKQDAEKCFVKGNVSAGIRFRKSLKEISVLLKTLKAQSLLAVKE